MTQKNSTNFETHRDKKYTSFCCCTSIVVSGGRGRAAIVAVVTFSIVLLLRDGNFCLTHGYPTLMGRVLPGPIRNRVGYGFKKKKPKAGSGWVSGFRHLKLQKCPLYIYIYIYSNPNRLIPHFIFFTLQTSATDTHTPSLLSPP